MSQTTTEVENKKVEFTALEDQIRTLLSQRLGQGLMEVDDIIAITLELGKAKSVEDLREAISQITASYPIMKEVLLSEEQEKREDMHDVVQKFVSTFMLTDVVKAAQLSEMALRKDVTLEELFSFCPEFQEYYTKNKQN